MTLLIILLKNIKEKFSRTNSLILLLYHNLLFTIAYAFFSLSILIAFHSATIMDNFEQSYFDLTVYRLKKASIILGFIGLGFLVAEVLLYFRYKRIKSKVGLR
jgi:hypothetical protein